MSKRPTLIRPTPEEDAAIARGIANDPDTYEFSDEDFAAAAQARKRGRPHVISPKAQVTLRLDSDLLEALRSSGPGWQTRVNDQLRRSFMQR